MRDPFAFLGIGHDADERAIKRAYALRLRNTRPDIDPAGFQTLNEAYRLALEWARERDDDARHAATVSPVDAIGESAAIDASAFLINVAEPTPAAESIHVSWTFETSAQDETPDAPAEYTRNVQWESAPHDAQAPTLAHADAREHHESFDFPAFFDTLCERAADGDAEALDDWLQRQPAFWSLSLKAQAGFGTMSAIGRQAPPMPDRCFDVVLAFFDMDHVLAGQDALHLGRLRRRLHMEWLLLHGHRELANELKKSTPSVHLAIPIIFRLLSGPFRWTSVLRQGLPPERPREVAAFLQHLQAARVERLPPEFDHRRISFWMRAGDRSTVSMPRFAIGFVRGMSAILLALAVDVALSMLAGSPLAFASAFVLIAFVLWLAYLTWLDLSVWQSLPQEAFTASAPFWRRLLFVPSIAIAACARPYLLPNAVDDNPGTGALVCSGLLVALAIILAITRYRRRANSGPIRWGAHFGGWRILFIMPALKALIAAGAFVVYYIEVGAALAITIWLADLWKQRARLRGIS